MINVEIHTRTKRFAIKKRPLALILEQAGARLGLADVTIAVSFVTPARMKSLNTTWRGKNKSTDVLSFSQMHFPKPLTLRRTRNISSPRPQLLGDIVISPVDAARNAKRLEHSLADEVAFLLIHGLLHLCGHDHEKPSEERHMFALQAKLMRRLTEGQTRQGRFFWHGAVNALPKATKP